MRLKQVAPVALFVLAAHAGSAQAFFDVQVMAGKRWYELDGDEKTPIASQEIDVAAHIDPIPMVPVAFGASVALGTLRTDDIDEGSGDIKDASTFEAGLDIMAWLPMVPFVTPYARLKYPIVGTMVWKGKGTTEAADGTITENDAVITQKIEGPHLNIGVKYSPLPIIKILAEVGMGMQTAALEELKFDGEKADLDSSDKKKEDFKSNAFLLGVEIGL